MTGFRCKEFTVEHDRCGMKVNTDSLMLGAWAEISQAQSALDIGTGSGILSLMLAQRLSETANSFLVTGVDIEPEAAKQAAENFAASRWAAQLKALCTDICTYQAKEPFDLIISNPPYFTSGQQLECQKRQQARLEDSLSFAELVKQASRLSHEKTRFALVLPSDRGEEFGALAQASGWFLMRRLWVEPVVGKAPKRVLLEFSRTADPLTENRLQIRDQNNQYTQGFKELTRDFYLAF